MVVKVKRQQMQNTKLNFFLLFYTAQWHFQHYNLLQCSECTALDWIAFFAMLRATTVQISDGFLDKQRRLIWNESVHKTGPHHLFEVTVMHWLVESEDIFQFKFSQKN